MLGLLFFSNCNWHLYNISDSHSAARREMVTSRPSPLHFKTHKAFIIAAQFSEQAPTYLGFSSSCIFKREQSFYTIGYT